MKLLSVVGTGPQSNLFGDMVAANLCFAKAGVNEAEL